MRPEELAALLTQLVNQRPSPTAGACTEGYLSAAEFTSLSPGSQKAIRRVLRRWHTAAGLSERPIASLTRADLVRSLDCWPPGSRNTVFRRVRVMLRWSIARGYRPDDPTIGLSFKPLNGARPEWTAADIDRFRAAYPIGHRARLILELALALGQRRGDLSTIRWEHFSAADGQIWLSLTQAKTKTPLAIPLLPEARACLRAVPPGARRGHVICRKNALGRRLTPESLGNVFQAYAREAGVLGRLHGLRRYCCTRLAEAGATPHQIAAVSGHRSLSQVSLYTKRADQRGLALAAIALVCPP